MNNITQWSYSRHETWERCPRQAYYRFVQRLPEGEKGPALVRGIVAHEACAMVYNGQWPKMPAPVTQEWLHVLSKHKSFYGGDLEAELQIAFDKDWQQTAWFNKQTVYRAAFDGLAYTPARERILQIYEHKTGKKRPEQHLSQAGWYAGVSTLIVPDAEEIVVDIHYLDYLPKSSLSILQAKYPRKVADSMLVQWKERAAEMMADTEFPTRAGPHCNWCPYANSKGGPCALG
jgi:hypothetical protein